MGTFAKAAGVTCLMLGCIGTFSAPAQTQSSIPDIPNKAKAEIIEELRALAAPPANDTFGSAQILTGSSTINGSTADATDDNVKIDGEQFVLESAVWFKWRAPASPSAVILDTIGSGFDTVLWVFTGTSEAALTAVAVNDDFLDLQSVAAFRAVPGTEYYIALSGFDDAAKGSFILTTSVRSVSPAAVR